MRRVQVFDVNETLLDLAAMDPHFQRIFGDAGVRLAWFDQMIQSALVATVTGAYSQFGAHAMAALAMTAERAGVVFMNPESSSPTLHTRGFKWYFRTSPHDGHFTQGMFDFMEDFKKKQNVPLKTLGLTYEDTLFGEDSGKTQKELAERMDGRLVLSTQGWDHHPRTASARSSGEIVCWIRAWTLATRIRAPRSLNSRRKWPPGSGATIAATATASGTVRA